MPIGGGRRSMRKNYKSAGTVEEKKTMPKRYGPYANRTPKRRRR